MTIYYVIYAILLILTLCYGKRVKSPIPVIAIALLLWLVAAWKDTSVGSDSFMYYINFEAPFHYSDARSFSGIQRGWYYVNVFFNQVADYRTFMMICYGIIVGGFTYYIRKESPYTYMSLFLFVAFWFYLSSFNIMRQYIALGMVFPFIPGLPKKKIPFIIACLVASTIHTLTIVLLSFLFIDKLRITNRIIVLTTVIVTMVIGYLYSTSFFGTILSPIASMFGEGFSDYTKDIGGQRKFIVGFLTTVFFIISYLLAKDRKDPALKAYFLYIAGYNLFGSMGNGNRLFIFLQLPMMIALPRILKQTDNVLLRILYFIGIVGYGSFIFFYSFKIGSGEIVPYRIGN